MTPLSLSCFLTASTRMFVDCLHIFRMVSGGKWIYPTEEETASAITSTTPAPRSRLRVGIGNPSGAERHRSPAAAAGETLNREKPKCRRGHVQRLDTHHGLFASGILEVLSDKYSLTWRP